VAITGRRSNLTVRAVTTLEEPQRPQVVCEWHEGTYRALVQLGEDAWSYYFMTRKQLRFWKKLSRRERGLIARKEARSCFLCALDAASAEMEKFEEGLYGALMGSLLM
jgi:hypothetical protein